ncbi:class I SAM-dependent methyltransferase [Candidatus Harpocratesius sp.]
MEKDSAKIMVETIYDQFGKTSYLDLGAGPCLHSNGLANRGGDVVAVDGSIHSLAFISKKVKFILQDLTQPFNLKQKFNIVLCFEVIEHIDEKYEQTVTDNIVNNCQDTIIMTCAIPGQKGRNHVNLKPLKYWKSIFIEKYKLKLRKDLCLAWKEQWEKKGVLPFYINNLLIFQK